MTKKPTTTTTKAKTKKLTEDEALDKMLDVGNEQRFPTIAIIKGETGIHLGQTGVGRAEIVSLLEITKFNLLREASTDPFRPE